MTAPDLNPCELHGDCEPHESDENNPEAMCRHCGGWRYKDSPTWGNWGTKPRAIGERADG